MYLRRVSLAAVAVALLAPAIAVAQAVEPTAGATPDAAPAASGGLDDIVVTARRTSESLQTVPVAVTALSGAFLEQQNVRDVSTVPQFTPNLTIKQQSGSPTAASVFIRGIGNQEPSSVAEQGVGIYLDGVYVARSAGAIFDLVDLERIEVLRGPQGTLFGRNTVGGAIQLVSKKPSNDFHVEGRAGFGRYDDWFARARVDTGYIGGSPIKASISAMHRQRNGFVDNLLTKDSRDPGALNGDAVMANVQADLGDVTVNYAFDYNDRRGASPYFQTIVATDATKAYFGRSEALGGDPYIVSRDRLGSGLQAGFVDRKGDLRYDGRSKVQGHSITIAYEPLDVLTLKSITAYRKFSQDTILTLNGNGNLRGVVFDPTSPTLTSVQTVSPYTGNNAPQRQWQFSQEFQALGTAGEFSYVGGFYYFYEKAYETNRQSLTLVAPVAALPFYGIPADTAAAVASLNPGLDLIGLNSNPVQAFKGTAESMAVFGQVSWKPQALDEKLELTGGIRYTSDVKTILLRGDVQPNQSGRANFENVSYLASVNYRFTPGIMAYARFSTGYRSGGFNPRAVTLNAFDPEEATSYEIGLKSEFFDRRLRLNLAAFQTDYDNLQVNQFASGSSGATSLVVNAGKVRFRGVEAELTAVPIRKITIDASAGYTKPDFKQFLYRDPATNEIVDVAREAHMPQVSKLNAHVGAQYATDITAGTLTARVDYAYRSKIIFYPLDRTSPFNNDIAARPDHNLRARLSLSDITLGAGKMEVGIWGDNLTNQKNIDFAIDFSGLGYAGASFKQPRTYGVDAKISF